MSARVTPAFISRFLMSPRAIAIVCSARDIFAKNFASGSRRIRGFSPELPGRAPANAPVCRWGELPPPLPPPCKCFAAPRLPPCSRAEGRFIASLASKAFIHCACPAPPAPGTKCFGLSVGSKPPLALPRPHGLPPPGPLLRGSCSLPELRYSEGDCSAAEPRLLESRLLEFGLEEDDGEELLLLLESPDRDDPDLELEEEDDLPPKPGDEDLEEDREEEDEELELDILPKP
mmetsp:Transcript_18585/g.46375  ORF Transcript_18585/g.46375 Transcript_18585/m.46375 type:complete len:232 (-) Transcript_18585:192-887(-)